MTNAFSFGAVIALWLATSFLLWAGHRLFRRRSDNRSLTLARQSLAVLDAAGAAFREIRGARANPKRRIPLTDEHLRDDTRVLLNTIEAQSPFFDSAKELSHRIQKRFALPDFMPLSEILQIRRDLWAAAEIILVDDLRDLGPDFADAAAYDSFRAEARGLLFGLSGAAAGAHDDAVELRLTVARDEARRFAEAVEAELVTRAAKERITRPADVLALPLELLRSLPRGAAALRTAAADFLRSAHTLAGSMRQSDAVTWSLNELRRARDDLPDRFATAFEKAGGMARQGSQGLKRHYEFLLEARELQARYVEMLQRAPDLSEKARQFLDRLELEKRAEQMRLGSRGLLSRLRNALVVAIAWLIRSLQHVQAWITPPEHKQLAVIPPRAVAPARDVAAETARTSIRRPLPPPKPASATLDDAAETFRQRRREPRDRLQDDPLPRDGAERVRALFGGRQMSSTPDAALRDGIELYPAPDGASASFARPHPRADRQTGTPLDPTTLAEAAPVAPGAEDVPGADPTGRGFFGRLFRRKPKTPAKPEKSIKDILAAAGSFDSLDDPGLEHATPRKPRPESPSLAARLSGLEMSETSPAAGRTPAAEVALPKAVAQPSTRRRRFFGRRDSRG